MKTMEMNQQSITEKPKQKILYFEGAGMDFYKEAYKESDVGNFRIRTAFTNDQGDQYYLEMHRSPNNGLYVSQFIPLTGGHNNSIQFPETNTFTKEHITNWINSRLACSFDTIEVLSRFHGYLVIANRDRYNLIDNHVIDHELAAKRATAYEKIDKEYRLALNEKYSKIYLKEMDDQSITIGCTASDKSVKRANLPRIQRIEI